MRLLCLNLAIIMFIEETLKAHMKKACTEGL